MWRGGRGADRLCARRLIAAFTNFLQVEEELSEEDQRLKEDLELMVERVGDAEPGVQLLAIESIAKEIKCVFPRLCRAAAPLPDHPLTLSVPTHQRRTATTSMTSVPKPLKFLRPHYDALAARLDAAPPGAARAALADVLSALAMTSAREGARDTLRFKLAAGDGEVSRWGHEYVRHLAGEVGEEFHARGAAEPPQAVDDLMALAAAIVPWDMAHNAEPEGVDLALEVDRLDLVVAAVDAGNAARTCLYLLAAAAYLPEPDDAAALRAAFDAYIKVGRHADALRVALRAGDRGLAAAALGGAPDPADKRQLALMLGEARWAVDLESGPAAVADDALREELAAAMGNARLSERYLALARDLDVTEAKTPEDVYKSHLVEGRAPSGPAGDSARANLAATFVNGFVNAGFGQDKLVTAAEGEGGGADGAGEAVHWIFRNKDHGKLSAAASLGLVLLWDVEGGLPQIDRFLYASDPHVVGGALLAVGVVASGVADEVDPAFAILSDYVEREDAAIRTGATLGLGVAYAGREKQEVADLLLPVVGDPAATIDAAAGAALAVALCFVGAAAGDAVEAILQALMTRPEAELATPGGRLMALALGLLFLGRREAAEATSEVARTLPESASRFVRTTLEACAYAGTGDVLRVQSLLAACGEHIEVEEGEGWRAAHQAVAALGLGLVAAGEELGAAMAHRALEHLLQYGDAPARRGVPLALALLNVSSPDATVVDTLGRLSHDADGEVAAAAVLALGVIGAGTNNARLAGLLRQLSGYYYKDATLLFLVRIAQGLVHAGKGLLTLSPRFSDGAAASRPALAGVLVVLFSCLDAKATIAGRAHHLLYCLVPAMRPRMLMTVDEAGALLPVPVRVGQAVDVVAQAGRPKSISGFQTHTSPVLLAAGERAELGTEKWLPRSGVMEGVVILRPNPDYVEANE